MVSVVDLANKHRAPQIRALAPEWGCHSRRSSGLSECTLREAPEKKKKDKARRTDESHKPRILVQTLVAVCLLDRGGLGQGERGEGFESQIKWDIEALIKLPIDWAVKRMLCAECSLDSTLFLKMMEAALV